MSSSIIMFDWMDGVILVFCLVGGTRKRGARMKEVMQIACG
jgi:hypothetical protein